MTALVAQASFWLEPPASTSAQEHDVVFYTVLWTTGIEGGTVPLSHAPRAPERQAGMRKAGRQERQRQAEAPHA